MSDKFEVLRKIRALMAKAKDEASSDNEVYIFMAKAQELMAKHKIEESELELSKEEITSKFFDIYVKVFDQINSYINKEYLSSLAFLISNNNFCKSIYNASVKERDDKVYYYDRIRFIGKIDDVNNAMELFNFSFKKFISLARVRYEEAKRVREQKGSFRFVAVNSYQYVDKLVFFRSYLKGTLKGLEEKYEESSAKLGDNTNYGLIVFNYKHSINNFIEQNIGKISSSESRDYKNQDNEAFELGKVDAKNNTINQIENE